MVKYYVQSTGRYLASRGAIDGERLLHRQVWVRHNGPIPEGYEIHHKDGDWRNNAIENLECVDGREHARHHLLERFEDAEFKKQNSKNLKKAQEAAKAWHSTEEGLAFHSELGRLSWGNRQPVTLKCEACGCDFEAKRTEVARYCSRACSQSVQFRTYFTDTRKCLHCGTEFAANRHRATAYCSRACSNKHRGSKKKE